MIYDFDGYHDYSTAQIGREHVRVEASTKVSIVSGGRNGGNRLSCLGDSTGLTTKGRVVRAVPTVQTLCWGQYITISALPATVFIYDVRDSTNSHVLIGVQADGSILAARSAANNNGDFGANGSVVASGYVALGSTSAGVVLAGQPFAFKAKVTVDDAAGVVELYVNGVQVLNLTGQDTRNAGTATITNLLMGSAHYSGGNAETVYFEDFWCGSTVLAGDRRVDSHYPIQDGTLAQFTPSSGSDHYAMVDEAVADDDTSKVTTTTPGNRDTYKVESFKNPGGAIDAIKTVLTCKKVAANSAQLATCIYSNAAPHDGTAQGLTTTWMNVGEVAALDPGTESAWAEAAFGSGGTAEFGQHKAA